MNKFLFLFLLSLCANVLFAQTESLPQLGKSSIDDVIKAMTLDEKVRLLTGTGEVEEDLLVAIGHTYKLVPGAAGTTYPIPRLGIPAIVMADGPAGLRISPKRDSIDRTFYCTAFPIASQLASTWDLDLVNKVGKAMGNEVLEYGCDVFLAPALNIHRNPLCGRNFEYYSEDPYLSGKMAVAMVNGVESNGVGTSVKHFAVNNQETNRIANDSRLSERVMREIYLKAFEMLVKEADPWTVMSSYNKINGVYTSQSYELLTEILRNEWGFKGLVVTDWFGGRDAVAQVKAGNDLIMPGKILQYQAIKKAVEDGSLSIEDVDRNVRRMLELILKTPRFKKYEYSNNPDLEGHALICRQAAAEGMVLLKNVKSTLPLDVECKNVALFGNTSYRFISGGTGSGDVQEAYTVSLEQGLGNAKYRTNKELRASYINYLNSEIKKINSEKYKHVTAPRILEMSVSGDKIGEIADSSDIAIITIGRNSGEYSDRRVVNDFELSEDEIALINDVTRVFHKKSKKVVLILNVGGVIETSSWIDNVDAVLLAWQGGQEAGNAVADILRGELSPSGKLPMTFPIKYEDHASSKNFPVVGAEEAYSIYREFYTGPQGSNRKNIDYTNYDEGIYVGYRHFDKAGLDVAFPFGYGLSYTSFKISKAKITSKGDHCVIECKVKNTGKVEGKEVVQIYVKAPGKTMDKAEKELKAFAKTKSLKPGESEVLSMVISKSDLTSFDEKSKSWELEEGKYHFYVATSSRDISNDLISTISND